MWPVSTCDAAARTENGIASRSIRRPDFLITKRRPACRSEVRLHACWQQANTVVAHLVSRQCTLRPAMPSIRNVFACLVHERQDCVVDLVRNLRSLDPDSLVL